MHHNHNARKTVLSIFLLFIAISLTYSCKRARKHKKEPVHTDFSYDNFAEELKLRVPALDSLDKTNYRSVPHNVRYAYEHNDYDPIWLSHGYKADTAAVRIMQELEEIKWDGLNPERYNLAQLKKLKEKLGKKETTLAEAIAFDTALTYSYLMAASDLLFGKITPKKVDSLWYHANDSSWNAAAALTSIQEKFAPLDAYRSAVPTYSLLRAEYKHYMGLAGDTSLTNAITTLRDSAIPASEKEGYITTIINKTAPWITTSPDDSVSEWAQLITTYQDYMGIKPTAKLDSTTLACLTTLPDSVLPKITANLERLRWMQRDFGDLYVLVDIPLMQLFLRQGGKNAMHMRVVVGKKERQTPSLYARMANVVINPPWGVPPTILKKEVLPGIQKNGKAYLAKKGLKIYDNKGKQVSVSTITAKNYKRYNYKQAPGDDNALGYVKFNLPNPWDIYLHDTPHRGDFVKRERALSSGCIRVQYPQEMALFILSQLEKKKFDQEKLDSIIKTHKTQWNVLANKIPVHITYLTAFEDTTGQHIHFIKDVYHRDDKLISMLGKEAAAGT